MLADKYGGGRVIVAGAALYAVGLLLMACASSEFGFIISGGLLIGLGQSGTTYPVIFGVISRPDFSRSSLNGDGRNYGR